MSCPLPVMQSSRPGRLWLQADISQASREQDVGSSTCFGKQPEPRSAAIAEIFQNLLVKEGSLTKSYTGILSKRDLRTFLE